MKINTRKKPYKKYLAIGLILALVIGGSYAAYAITQDKWPFRADQSSNNDPSQTSGDTPSDPNATTTEPTTSDTATGSSPDATTSPKTPTENEPSKPSDDKLGVTITSVQTVGDEVRVRSLIETVTTSGSCKLTLARNGKTVSQTSGIQATASSSTCKGFTIPRSQLSAGSWHITLTVMSEGKTGSATRDFMVT